MVMFAQELGCCFHITVLYGKGRQSISCAVHEQFSTNTDCAI